MRELVIAIETVPLLTGCAAAVNLSAAAHQQAASQGTPAKAAKAPSADVLDKLLAPIALYPDQLLAQMLLCAANPGKVAALNEWLASHPDEKGTALQDAATKAGFDASFVALVLFPDVVSTMAGQVDWTTQLGEGLRRGPDGGLRQHPAAARPGAAGRHAQGHAAAGGRNEDDVLGRAGDRHRAGQSAGRLRSAIQPAGGLHPAPRPWSSSRAAAPTPPSRRADRLHRRHRDRRRDRQRLLLRSVRLGRRRVHVQRCVGRLVRRPRGCARGLAGSSRGHRRRARRPRARTRRKQRSERTETRQENRPESQAQREQRRSDAQARADGQAGARTAPSGRSVPQRAPVRPPNPAATAAPSATAAERSGTSSDAFSGYSSGKSERAASAARAEQPEQLAGFRQPPPLSVARRVLRAMGRSIHVRGTRASRRGLTASCAIQVMLFVALALALTAGPACRRAHGLSRSFATPEDGVKALIAAAASEKVDDILQIFRTGGKELIDASDPASARRGREVFSAAAAERWSLDGRGRAAPRRLSSATKTGRSRCRSSGRRRAGGSTPPRARRRVVSRRDRPQRVVGDRCLRDLRRGAAPYARDAHDGKPSGVYAAAFRSDPGKQNGLYWPPARGGRRSPLGDLLAEAADQRRPANPDRQPAPFHGYYFRDPDGAGRLGRGGAKNYIVNGEMTGGFALVAWPAQYDVTGVMTFIVDDDGVVRQKDLGAGTDGAARAISAMTPTAPGCRCDDGCETRSKCPVGADGRRHRRSPARQPALPAGQDTAAGHAQRLVHGSGLHGPRPHAGPATSTRSETIASKQSSARSWRTSRPSS